MGKFESFAVLCDIQSELLKAHQELGNWRAVGRAFGLSGAMAWRIGKTGYEPKDVHIRLNLNLPTLLPAAICRVCGEVHTTRRCVRKRRERRYRSLWAMPVVELRWALENREEV